MESVCSQFAVDTETTGTEGIRDGTDYAVGVSVAYSTGLDHGAMYFPFKHVGEGNYSERVLDRLRGIIERADRIVFHNAKFDLVSLRTLGINYTGEFYCTLIIANLINENYPFSKDLSSLTRRYVGEDVAKDKPEWFEGLIKHFGWGMITAQQMAAYATQDAVITLKLIKAIWPLYLKEATEEIWQHKQRLIRVIIDMEARGIGINEERVQKLILEGERVMEEMTAELNFNAASRDQKEEFFIHKLGLPVLKRSDKTGKPSFDKSVMPEYEEMLERMAPGNKAVEQVLTFNGWQHAMGLFYRPWLELRSEKDGRIHTSYMLHKDENDGGTVTGRLSSRKPNLQQIPRLGSKPWNKETKLCFQAKPGYVLVEADYSQLELRLATAYAQERGLMEVFNAGRDIFTEMSYQLNLTRDQTKTFVYSIQYGAGNQRISNVFRVSIAEARRLRENYFATYPGFAAFGLRAQNVALNTGKIRIWSGRHRHFRDREAESHKAMNACIQGGAADIVERMMVKCANEVADENCHMLLQIHDALVFEVRKDMLEHYALKIKAAMEDVDSVTKPVIGTGFGVKFNVDAHILGSKESIV